MPDGVTYNHETVALDGQEFTRCDFRSCRMVFAGGEPPVFADCRFEDCDWKFEDAAARTLAHLNRIWSVGAKPAVQAAIKDITGAAR